ncbi:MAG: hypothetical protein ACKOBS_06015, partial [Verrucomicrobiota bacterium]
MKSLTRTSLSLALALVTMTGLAQDAAKKAETNSPLKWEAMDYGRLLSAAIDNNQCKSPLDHKGCAANKALLVNHGNREARF